MRRVKCRELVDVVAILTRMPSIVRAIDKLSPLAVLYVDVFDCPMLRKLQLLMHRAPTYAVCSRNWEENKLKMMGRRRRQRTGTIAGDCRWFLA